MANERNKKKRLKKVGSFTHKEESRKNIPTSEFEPLLRDADKSPIQKVYERRNRDLDPQLIWRGKDEQDEANLNVQAPPLYIQEKVHPKVLIEELRRESDARATENGCLTPDLFADFNGLPSLEAKTEFYQHEQNWSNRMILGDSLQVMVSLAERENLRGKVQCIYVDPPYGIKFNSNFQWSTTSRDVKDGKKEHITREPEQVKAFRDTWRDGIHSYLTYLRDRLTVARDLLTDSGSIFLQIGDENVHRVRAVMDEVFGEDNFLNLITCRVSSGTTRDRSLKSTSDYLIWYAKDVSYTKFRRLLQERELDTTTYNRIEEESGYRRSMSLDEKRKPSLIPAGSRAFSTLPLHSMSAGENSPRSCCGTMWQIPAIRSWRFSQQGFQRLLAADRVNPGKTVLRSIYYHDDYPAAELHSTWSDTSPESEKSYVVQTSWKTIQRCILMATDPGDLVLDPTCGAGTTAYVAEMWGRRWITIDTSRVALALARARIMGTNFPFYLLTDSRDGQLKEAEINRVAPSKEPTFGRVNRGFVYERVPHVSLKSIANNEEIDVIYNKFQPEVDSALAQLNRTLTGHDTPFPVNVGGRKGSVVDFNSANKNICLPSGEEAPATKLLEWEVPYEAPVDWPSDACQALKLFWGARNTRQNRIDASIKAQAEFKFLYDKPYEDTKKVRVAGPFTVESLTPHRSIEATSSEPRKDSEQPVRKASEYRLKATPAIPVQDFSAIILEQLRSAGVQQADKRSKVNFTSLQGWPGNLICAEGNYQEGGQQRRAGILIGPEHGTLGREDLVGAAREAAESGFDILIVCAFNYDAQTTEVNKLGKLPVLKARMNADLHMSTDLKKSKSANLFVVFGEPDIKVLNAPDKQIQVKVRGIDIFDPRLGEVRSSEPDELACWFIDTNYDMESFFVRHAYFLGASNPYKNLKQTLKAEIDEEAWGSLCSDTSRPFDKPATGRIAVKAINHLGDEVMKVIQVS